MSFFDVYPQLRVFSEKNRKYSQRIYWVARQDVPAGRWVRCSLPDFDRSIAEKHWSVLMKMREDKIHKPTLLDHDPPTHTKNLKLRIRRM